MEIHLPDIKSDIEIRIEENQQMKLGDLLSYKGLIKDKGLDAVRYQRRIRKK